MKRLIALVLAMALCLSLAGCSVVGKLIDRVTDKDQEEYEVPAATAAETVAPAEEMPAVEMPSAEVTAPAMAGEGDPGEVGEKLQGVWVNVGAGGMLTFYAYQGNQMETYVVTTGNSAAPFLSGTFQVGDSRINYDFGSATGFSNYYYDGNQLTLTDGNGNPIEKVTPADLTAYMDQETASGNRDGVICLANLIIKYYPDSQEAGIAADRKANEESVIKAEGEKALASLKTTYDQAQGITWYQSKSEPQYVDICCYIYPYIGRMDDGQTWLRVGLNYTDAQTGAGWLFFHTVTFYVDGEATTRQFSSNEINRDNDTEVWETADYEPTAAEIGLLRRISNSDETIIRFQGNQYYYDHVVTAQEKEAIATVLAAYDYLLNYYE